MKEWLSDNVFTVISALFGSGSFFAYFNEKSKRKIEERQQTADALSKMQENYAVFVEDMEDRFDSLKLEIEGLKKQLQIVNKQLEEETKKYNELKTQFQNYKKKPVA
jgi:TolA-binding protein